MVLPVLAVHTSPAVILYADGGTIGGSPGSQGIYWSVGQASGPTIRNIDTSGKLRHSQEAEFRAFIEAVRYLRDTCAWGDTALILTDCESVVHHFGRKRPLRHRRNRTLAELYDEAQALLLEMRFQGIRVCIERKGRDEVVAVLGH